MAIQFKQQTKLGKALSRSKMIVSEFFEKWRFYSFKLAIYNTAWWVGNYCHPLVKLQIWAKHRITSYMDKLITTKPLVPLQMSKSAIVNCDEYKIWIFWWQGEDSMPELVKSCFQQVKRNNKNVILITKDNIRQYSDIPDYIFNKVENGNISFTHLSDILRVCLLAKYGGIWLDSTCWIPGPIPEEVKNMKFISPKTLNQPELPYWSDSRWCSWCSGTNIAQNPLFVFTRDVFYDFYKKNSRFPFYLFTDYIYDYAYRNIPEVKTMIDDMPENNVNRNKLHFMLNKLWNEQEYKDICKGNWVFKLSYKSVWKKYTTNGEQTFYGKLISNE